MRGTDLPWYCLNCTFSGKSLKLLPSDVVFSAKMHQIRFRLGLLQTLLGKLTALPRPLAGFKGPISRGREERRGKGRKRQGRGEEGAGREERAWVHPPSRNPGYAHASGTNRATKTSKIQRKKN